MSYILDALRKADAQRERDASRGIHAQPASLGTPSAAGAPERRGGWVALAAAGMVVAAAAGWYFTRSEVPPPVVTAPPAVVPSPPAAAAISPPPPAPMAPAALQAREAAFTKQATAAPAATDASAVAAPIPGGLPADAPRVAISGGVYSPNPAQRLLIVNGQVFNEGSEVAPGVKVEAIQARTATLSFRGGRYTVAY
ncbi:general secretion pathway protein GspB [Ramlibacter sp. PS4R-6]|uniref:general secretion pathway protein GspB n=1 Tax=Ramlibacter sp. PS4R-6 TaxID=3133438 RepID=UPI0030A9BE0C